MYTSKKLARTFGIAFLIGYLSYGLGFGFLNVFLSKPDALSLIVHAKNLVILEAAVLMAVFAPINIVLGVIMTPIFKKHNVLLAYGYLSAAIASSLLLIVGAIFLLLSIPLSEAYVSAGSGSTQHIELLFVLIKKANFFSYQIAMVIWGLGGFIFSYMLYLTKLVPTWLSVWGIVGYAIFVAGAFFALFGIPIDVILDIPGGLFEIFVSIRFIIKGFDESKQQVVS